LLSWHRSWGKETRRGGGRGGGGKRALVNKKGAGYLRTALGIPGSQGCGGGGNKTKEKADRREGEYEG